MTFYYRQFFSCYEIDKFTAMGLTVDGNDGGLLIGNPHDNDGVPVLMRYSDGYRIIAEFEGNEYLVNTGATKQFKDRLSSINNFDRDKQIEYSETFSTTASEVLNCKTESSIVKSKFLILDGRSCISVVNKYSTWLYLTELEQINNSVGWRFLGDFLDWENAAAHPKYDTTQKESKANFMTAIIDWFKRQ